MSVVTYECIGSVCGGCGHRHRTLSGAVRCLQHSISGCASQGGYSDRAIVRSDGEYMVEDDGDWIPQSELAPEVRS